MSSHLLPSNATAEERALSLAVLCGEDLLPERLRTLWDPLSCPLSLLPWLAWGLHVDEWDESWPEAVKRQVVASSMEVHRRKGTIWATRRVLLDVGHPVTVTETETPYIFDLLVELSEGADLGVVFSRALRAAERGKNVRSHLGHLGAGTAVSGGVTAGCAAVGGLRCEVAPWTVRQTEVSGGAVHGGTVHGHATVEVGPAG